MKRDFQYNEKILKICSILPGAHKFVQREKELKLVHYTFLLFCFIFSLSSALFPVLPPPSERDCNTQGFRTCLASSCVLHLCTETEISPSKKKKGTRRMKKTFCLLVFFFFLMLIASLTNIFFSEVIKMKITTSYTTRTMLFMFKQYEKKLSNTFSFTYRSNNRNKVFALIQQNLFFCLMEIFLQPSLLA